MNVRDLGVTIKANVKGLESLKAFNEELKNTLQLAKNIKGVSKIGADVSKALIEGDASTTKANQNAKGRKGGIVGILTFLKDLKSAPIIASLIYIAKSVVDITKKIGSLALSLSQTSYEVLKLSRNFGVSADSIQRFGNLAVAQGVKLGDFQSAIGNLRKLSADIMLGRGDISPFAILGINPHQDPEKILIQLQQRLKQLPEAVGTAFASDLGLSPDMINFVRRTDFGKLANQPKLSGSELRALEDLRGTLLETLNLITIRAQKVLADFKPVIDAIIVPINKFFKMAMNDMFKLKTIALGSIFAISVGLMAMGKPIGFIMASLTAIGVIVEDLVKTGGEGLIGWMEVIGLKLAKVVTWIIDKAIVEPIMNVLNTLVLHPAWTVLKGIANGATALSNFITPSSWKEKGISYTAPRGFVPPQIFEPNPSIGARSSNNENKVTIEGVFTLKDQFDNILNELNINSTSTTVSGVTS